MEIKEGQTAEADDTDKDDADDETDLIGEREELVMCLLFIIMGKGKCTWPPFDNPINGWAVPSLLPSL